MRLKQQLSLLKRKTCDQRDNFLVEFYQMFKNCCYYYYYNYYNYYNKCLDNGNLGSYPSTTGTSVWLLERILSFMLWFYLYITRSEVTRMPFPLRNYVMQVLLPVFITGSPQHHWVQQNCRDQNELLWQTAASSVLVLAPVSQKKVCWHFPQLGTDMKIMPETLTPSGSQSMK